MRCVVLLILHVACAVKPGAYYGNLDLPFGLSLKNARLIVKPNRHSLSLDFHSHKVSMNCGNDARSKLQEFTTSGNDIVLSNVPGERCVLDWMKHNGLHLRFMRNDPRAGTVDIGIQKSVWPITYKKTLHLVYRP